MEYPAKTLIILGVLFLLGLAIDTIGRRTRLPRVTLLLILGFLVGPVGLNLFSPQKEEWTIFITNVALVMVGFLLGGKFSRASLRKNARYVVTFSVSVVLATAIIVTMGLWIWCNQLGLALLFGGIATATDPLATVDIVRENKSKGLFTQTLLGIVAVDDAWGLILFSLILTIVGCLHGQTDITEPLLSGTWELAGAILVGIALGFPMAYLTGRIQKGEPTLVEALGIVFLCAGISIWLKVSYLLASMVLGCVVINFAHHHKRPFHAIENIESPFMILFFVLAGASLSLESIWSVGYIGVLYIVFRIMGRLIGAWLGGYLSQSQTAFRHWTGMALLPQAGSCFGHGSCRNSTIS